MVTAREGVRAILWTRSFISKPLCVTVNRAPACVPAHALGTQKRPDSRHGFENRGRRMTLEHGLDSVVEVGQPPTEIEDVDAVIPPPLRLSATSRESRRDGVHERWAYAGTDRRPRSSSMCVWSIAAFISSMPQCWAVVICRSNHSARWTETIEVSTPSSAATLL